MAGAVMAFVSATTAFAQVPPVEVGGAVTTFGIGDWFGLVVRLVLVVIAIWAAVRGMRWYVRRVNEPGRRGSAGALEVIETHALGPNRSLHLVRLGDRAVLVGATPERITQLLTVDDPDEFRRLTERPEEASRPVRARAGASIVSAFRTGLMAMQEQRRQTVARARAGSVVRGISGASTGAGADATASDSTSDAQRSPARWSPFATLRAALTSRRARSTAPVETPAPRRPSLFERTLASVDAIDAGPASASVPIDAPPSMPSSAGLRARNGYERAGTASGAKVPARETQREAQIADLQRAITRARKQAG